MKLPTMPVPLSTPPELTFTVEFAACPLTASVPAFTWVLPLYVSLPESTRAPPPSFVNPPLPLIDPL